MSETTVSVAGYLVFAEQSNRLKLGDLRRLLPRLGQPATDLLLRPGLILAGQVNVFLSVPGTCYPGSLGQLLEGFVCTFLDSLRPKRPEGSRGWRTAMNHWLHWPRDMVSSVEEEFKVGPAEIFGLVRLQSGSFEGEVIRAVLAQRELALTPLARSSHDRSTWPRVLRTEQEEGKGEGLD